MHLLGLCVAVLLAFAGKNLADTPARVLIPFGEAALWASSLDAVKECKKGDCDGEVKVGIPQAQKYALNNARMAIKNGKEKKTVDEGKKFDKIFVKVMKSFLKLFQDATLVKLLKESKVILEIPSDDIGLMWRSASYDIPIYKKEDLKKGLTETKFKMRDGVEIPRVGFGTWQMEGDECKNAVLEALRIGYRHIDTAQSYENEGAVGDALKEAISEGIINSRDDVFLVTKLSDPREYSAKKVSKRLMAQLELLKTNYTDVYMLHGPEEKKKNRATWKGMIQLQNEGKIRALGISNFDTVTDLKDLARNFHIKPNYIQNKFSIYNPGGQSVEQTSMLQTAEEREMAFVAYSIINPWPFALPPREDPHVLAIAKRYNRTPVQILNRWALQLNTIVIPKSKSADRIKENAEILEFALGEIDMRLLNGLSILAQSSTEQKPTFAKDIYELFSHDHEDKASMHDEL
eukprot:gene2298-17917_t